MQSAAKNKIKEYRNNPDYVYKMCIDKDNNPWFVVLKKCADTLTNESREVDDSNHAKYRANHLLVVDIFNPDNPNITSEKIRHKSRHYLGLEPTKIVYEKGQIIKADSFNKNIYYVCTNGIHFFKTPNAAFFWREIPKNFTGKWCKRYDDGSNLSKCDIVDGLVHGKQTIWWESYRIKGKKYGKDHTYSVNGSIKSFCEYFRGEKHGECISYNTDGKIIKYCQYSYGKKSGRYIEWPSEQDKIRDKVRDKIRDKTEDKTKDKTKNKKVNKIDGYYKNDEKNGLWTYYYGGGLKKYKSYIDGSECGMMYTEFCKNTDVLKILVILFILMALSVSVYKYVM
jgi:antitoxin component YwqK of YwqJK toxin-antitoxin module